MTPNALMIRFLTVVESGGTAGLDELEVAIAVATAIEAGWMSDDHTLTDAGRALTVAGTAVPEMSNRNMPPLMTLALREMGDGLMGYDIFEKRHGIPRSSAKLVLQLAREMLVEP